MAHVGNGSMVWTISALSVVRGLDKPSISCIVRPMSYRVLDTLPYRTGGSDNYRTIEQRLASEQPFEGNSMSAFRAEDGSYIVVSYRTVIAVKSANGELEVAKNVWGPTTGRHINLCKREL